MGTPPHRFARRGAAAFCGVSLLWAGGCAVGDFAQEAWFQTKQTLRPNAGGYQDDAETVREDWSEVHDLGGRRNRARVADDDAWYRKWVMSSKARDIESNLGFE